MSARGWTHPILGHPRTRVILFWFMLFAGVFGGFLWYKVNAVLTQAGLSVYSGPVRGSTLFIVLFSPIFRTALILLVGLIATAMTARHVVGPSKRISMWLQDWLNGHNVAPLEVRGDDKFSQLVHLINTLRQKTLQ